MPEEALRPRLGRGLAALMGDAGTENVQRGQRRVPIEFLRPNPRNPRKAFYAEELEELAASVRERGVIQPILVRAVAGATDAYEIIAGERRWRAAQLARLKDVPVVVVEASDRESLEMAVVENVQRTDLNPIEESEGYVRLMEEFGHSIEDIAKFAGKSRPHIANMVRLNKLSEPVKAYVREGKLSAGHARMLVGQPNALEFAAEIVKRGLNVRQVEAWARRDGKEQAREVKRTGNLGKDADTIALENRLTLMLGLGVTIEHRADGSGTVNVRYRRLEQLDEIVRKLESGTPAFELLGDLPTSPQAAARRIRDGIPLPGDEELARKHREGEAARPREDSAGEDGPRVRKLY